MLTFIADWTPEVFYDVPIFEQIFRLFLAAILGGILGMERELKSKPAGFITFMLVSLGSCLIALLQLNIINMTSGLTEVAKSDPSRIIAQVVSGVGFLGAGTIIHHRGNVKGITTAALLWVSAGIGLCVGIGGLSNYIIAVVTAICVFPLILIIRRLSRDFAARKKVHRMLIVFNEEYEQQLTDTITSEGGLLKSTFFHNKYNDKGINYKEVYFYIKMDKKHSYGELINIVSTLHYVLEVEEM